MADYPIRRRLWLSLFCQLCIGHCVCPPVPLPPSEAALQSFICVLLVTLWPRGRLLAQHK